MSVPRKINDQGRSAAAQNSFFFFKPKVLFFSNVYKGIIFILLEILESLLQ